MIGFRFALLAILATSLSSASSNEIPIFVEYQHGPVHVHYPILCAFEATCTLSSFAGVSPSWHIAVTPRYMSNGVVSIASVVSEDSIEVTRPIISSKIGEAAKIVALGPDGEPFEFIIRPNIR